MTTTDPTINASTALRATTATAWRGSPKTNRGYALSTATLPAGAAARVWDTLRW